LITTGETIRLLSQTVEQAGGMVVGIGCLWQRATKVDLGQDVFSMVKREEPLGPPRPRRRSS
jgi:adenine/guanine phosphoribosyltransferase-like PRPP-binding protein